jgi:hypothetical protein
METIAANMHGLPGRPGLLPSVDDEERGFFARRQVRADDLALAEESPSLWSHFYRTDINVYATGRQSSHGAPCATTSTNRLLPFVTHCSLQNQVCAGRLVDGLHTFGSTQV